MTMWQLSRRRSVSWRSVSATWVNSWWTPDGVTPLLDKSNFYKRKRFVKIICCSDVVFIIFLLIKFLYLLYKYIYFYIQLYKTKLIYLFTVIFKRLISPTCKGYHCKLGIPASLPGGSLDITLTVPLNQSKKTRFNWLY